jgi:hypothetical protein
LVQKKSHAKSARVAVKKKFVIKKGKTNMSPEKIKLNHATFCHLLAESFIEITFPIMVQTAE